MLDMEARPCSTPGGWTRTSPLAVPWLVARRDRRRPGVAARARRGPTGHPPRPRRTTSCPAASGATRATCRTPALVAWGETTARLGRALRGVQPPRAASGRCSWDIQHAARTRPMLDRRSATPASARWWSACWTATRPWSSRPGRSCGPQAVHTDLTTDNALVDDAGRITGIVDFGDMSHIGAARRPRAVLDSLCWTAGRATRSSAPPGWSWTATSGTCRSSRVELRLLGELSADAGRGDDRDLVVAAAQGLEEPEFAERYNETWRGAWRTTCSTTGWDEVARRFGADGAGPRRRRRRWSSRRRRGLRPGASSRSATTSRSTWPSAAACG